MTVVLVAGVLALIPVLRPSTVERPARAPVGAAPGTVPSPSGGEVDGLPVRGVPASLVAVDPETAVRSRPPMPVRPTGGVQRAYLGAGTQVSRVVVVLNFDEPLGLVGGTVDPEWLRSAALLPFKPLVTDHPSSSTAYLTAWSPTGNRWFIAVTAPTPHSRMTTLRTIATQTLPNT
ncbi:MAG TPA: hypothetical protein VF657_07340 [Actinoplanes sp.]